MLMIGSLHYVVSLKDGLYKHAIMLYKIVTLMAYVIVIL